MKQLCPSCGDEFDDGGYGFVECEGCRESETVAGGDDIGRVSEADRKDAG